MHTQPANPPLVALGSTWLLSVFLSPALFRQSVNRPVFQIRQHWRGFLLLGLIGGVTPIFGMTAFSLGNVAYVTTLFKLNTILTVLWSQW